MSAAAGTAPPLPLPADMAARVRVGVAGWSYPDWNGPVYPPGTRDRLAYLAAYLDAIEINSTFYRPPQVSVTAGWQSRTARFDSLRFTAKISREVSHEGQPPGPFARAFREGLAPLTDAGRLTHLLAQFRWDFREAPEARDRLLALREAFAPPPCLVLELRHASWRTPAAEDFLRGLGVTVANLDYPLARDSFDRRLCTIGEHAYFRLHGRNASAWYSREAGRDETYDYDYPPAELDEIAGRAAALAGMSKSLTLIANNHYRGKEFANALELRHRLTGRPPAVPPALVRAFPRLAAIAADPPPPGPDEPLLPL